MDILITFSLAIAVIGCIGAFVFRPISFTVSKSVKIKTNAQKAFDSLKNFREWPKWSPWIIMEPDAKIAFNDTNTAYQWDGELVGKGEMEHRESTPPNQITNDLRFEKPFKSKARIFFDLEEDGDEIEVTWTMNGRIPLVMAKTMSAFIGMDYERGLRMLKEHLENGTVSSKLKYAPQTPCEGFHYVGYEVTCSFEEMANEMQRSVEKNNSLQERTDIESFGPAICVYKKWRVVKREVTYIMAVQVKSIHTTLPEGAVSGSYPEHQALVVHHQGLYEYLGNAWSAGLQYLRSHKIKQPKGLYPYEVYLSTPENTAPKEVQTNVHLPVSQA